jgi:CHAD domain-containing protein
MAHEQHEIEETYTVADDTGMPALDQLPGVDAVQRRAEVELEATYFDTAELTLAAAGISLRRRTGGTDAGCHLKLPMKQGRFEVHESLARAHKTVPKALRTLLIAHTRDVDLQPVAVIRTRRQVHVLLDDEGTALAEFRDHRVTAESSSAATEPLTWREWELQLVEGDAMFLSKVATLIEDAGGSPTAVTKLARTLGDRVPVRPEQVMPEPTTKSPASEVVQARLLEQVMVIRNYDPLARRDAPDAVHKMRVAVRRLRNALATYRPLLVCEHTEPVRQELKWLAAALGEPRDAEVMRERLEEILAEEPPKVLRGAGYQRMDEEMRAEYARARERLMKALNSERYLGLLDRLNELAARPPWSEKAVEPVDSVLRSRVRHDYKRLARRVELADKTEEAGEREHRLHEARKAAKRVRYAAEALTGIYGKQAKQFVSAMKRVQSRLGARHDAFVTQERLRALGDEAARTGDNAFVFGVLHAREEHALLETDDQFVHEWKKASKRRRRRWLCP